MSTKKSKHLLKQDKIYKFVSDLAEKDVELLHKFAETIDPKELKKQTSPSAIAIGGIEEIGLQRLFAQDIERYLLMHPVIPRGIEIKTNRILSRGFTISPTGTSENAIQATKEMNDLFSRSGKEYFLKKWIESSYGFGNGYVTLVPNTKESKILRLNIEHPIYFRIARNIPDKEHKKVSSDFASAFSGTFKIDEKLKMPTHFTQVEYSNESGGFIPLGEELDADSVAHLTFDTWGDEVDGISIIQYVFLIIKYMLNIDEAAAESTYRSGFTQKKITTESMTDRDMKEIAKGVKKINSKDAVILPKGVDMVNLIPGTTQYPQIQDVFMTLLAIRLGIPKPLLTLDGTSTNKATLHEQTSDMVDDFRADELRIVQVIEDQIFTPACKMLYGEDFSEFPKIRFNPFTQSKEEKAAITKLIAETVASLTDSYIKLVEMDKNLVADKILALINESIVLDTDVVVKSKEKDLVEIVK